MNIKKFKFWATADTNDFGGGILKNTVNDPIAAAKVGFFSNGTKIADFPLFTGGANVPGSFYGSGIDPEIILGCGSDIYTSNASIEFTLDTVIENVTDIRFPIFSDSALDTVRRVVVAVYDENDTCVGVETLDGPTYDNKTFTLLQETSIPRLSKIRLTAIGDVPAGLGLIEVPSPVDAYHVGVSAYDIVTLGKLWSTTNAPETNNFNAAAYVSPMDIGGKSHLFFTTDVVPDGTFREFDLAPEAKVKLAGILKSDNGDSWYETATRFDFVVGNIDLGGADIRLEMLDEQDRVLALLFFSTLNANQKTTEYELDIYPMANEFPWAEVSHLLATNDLTIDPLQKGLNVNFYLPRGGTLTLACQVGAAATYNSLKFTTFRPDLSIADSQVISGPNIEYTFTAPDDSLQFYTVITEPTALVLPGDSVYARVTLDGIATTTLTSTVVASSTPPQTATVLQYPFTGSVLTSKDDILNNVFFKWYTFTTTEESTISFDTSVSRNTDIFDSVNSAIYSSTGELIAVGQYDNLTTSIPAGTYYIAVATALSQFADGFFVLPWAAITDGVDFSFTVEEHITTTIIPDDTGGTFGGFNGGIYVLSCIDDVYDDTFRCRVINQDGSNVRIRSVLGPAQNPTGVFAPAVDTTINGGFIVGDQFTYEIALSTGQWVDLVYDTTNKAFQPIGWSSNGVFAAAP